MTKIVIIFLAIFLVFNVFGEVSNNFLNPSFSTPSFLNMNNIIMNHSLSFQSGINSNNQGYYLSMYTNHLKFNFHPKLKLNLDLHFTNFGTATYSKNFDIEGNNDNQSQILPEIQMEYTPNENFKIRVEFGSGLRNYYYSPSLFEQWND